MRFLSSRKGDVDLSLVQVIGLILGFLIILAGFIIISNMLGLFSDSADDRTDAQFNELSSGLEVLYDEFNTNNSCKIEVGYIKPGFAFVGFNSLNEPNSANEYGSLSDDDLGYVEEYCGIDDNILKPLKCFDKACLCLCHGGSGDVTDNDCFNGKCKLLPDKLKVLHTIYNDDIVDLVLYGESCLSGSNYGTFAGYILSKKDKSVTIEPIFSANEFKNSPIPLCKSIISDLKQAKIKKEVKEKVQGQKVDSQVDSVINRK